MRRSTGQGLWSIATTKGWNVYVGGNGGAKPRHAEIIAEDVTLARRSKFSTASSSSTSDQPTSSSVRLDGSRSFRASQGLKVMSMTSLASARTSRRRWRCSSYLHCEWTKDIRDPERKKAFRHFVNTEDTQVVSEMLDERDQQRPADCPVEADRFTLSSSKLPRTPSGNGDHICKYSDLDPQKDSPSSATVKYGDTQIAVWNIPIAVFGRRRTCVLTDVHRSRGRSCW